MSGVARVPGRAGRPPRFARGRAHRPAGAPARSLGRRRPLVGVLAVQGDVGEHLGMLGDAGAEAIPVTSREDLDRVDGLVLPGGESTTIGRLLARFELLEVVRQRVAHGLATFGTCAGAILLAREATLDDGTPAEQPLLGALDVRARRNAFGRQVASFEASLDVAGLDGQPLAGGPLEAAFIRAPWFEDPGAGVESLATVATEAGDRIVVVRQGHILASAFHPELGGDPRLHAAFVELARRG